MLLELSRSLARPPCPARLGFPGNQPFFTGNSFRPRQDVLKGVKGVRKESTEAGDAMSGHIHAGPNEGIFFLDSRPCPYLQLPASLYLRAQMSSH